MKIQKKIVLGIILAIIPAFWFLVDWVLDDLTPQYRESTEEPLVDAAYVLAGLAASSARDTGVIDVALFRKAFDSIYQQKISAKIYKLLKTSVDFRVYITDRLGVVLFDSFNPGAEGEDYSRWRDVHRTLDGLYGARTSRDIPLEPPSSIMYVAAPIIHQGELIGVLSVGKPTKNANQFIKDAQREIYLVGAISALCAILVALFIAGMITRPIQRLTSYAAAVRDGARVEAPKVSGKELRELATAFESMRETLEGKHYVEKYVQTLTHEIKSPLSAIRGAVELLAENPPESQQKQFIRNIGDETQRVQGLIDKLLLLARIEAKNTLEDSTRLNLSQLTEETIEAFQTAFAQKELKLEPEIQDGLYVLGDSFLIRQAICNLLQNALEFSPHAGTIKILLKKSEQKVVLQITDDGPGIPAYAKQRVFERFYSLQRPDTGRKSSGLGLSFVREVAEIHRGEITLENQPKRGLRANLSLPGI